MVIKKKIREFFPNNFDAENWQTLQAELEKMKNEEIRSIEDLIKFIEKYSELSAILNDVMAWKYINMLRSTNDKKLVESYQKYTEEINAKAEVYFFEFDKKICNDSCAANLPEYYRHMLKLISKDIKIFREENIFLSLEEEKLSNLYQEKYSNLTVVFEKKERTVTQMLEFFRDPDRQRRESAWRLVSTKIVQEKPVFDKIFDELKEIRSRMAQNAGFDNFRDFMHQKKKRDYQPSDLFQLHESIEKIVVPFIKELNERRKRDLNVDTLKPWDFFIFKMFLAALFDQTLKPFDSEEMLIAKTLKILARTDPEFARIFNEAYINGFLDLVNRKDKAPGGSSHPLEESCISFILSDAIGNNDDVRGIVHEVGHQEHVRKKCWHKVVQYRRTPQETGEVAAMAMELFILDYLSEFYSDSGDLKQAKREILERTFDTLPWIAIVDAFQHWIYLNPDHTLAERDVYFGDLMERFNMGRDWTGFEAERNATWISQLHIFVVPFYYIEYAIAQFGAIAIYRNYKKNKEETLKKYKEFLALGNSSPVPEIYEAAGIKFDFSEKYIQEMVNFIKSELELLE